MPLVVAAYANTTAANLGHITQTNEGKRVIAKMKGNAVTCKLVRILRLIVSMKIAKARPLQILVCK